MSGKTISAKNVYQPFQEAPDPFTRDLNLTTRRRRTLERLFFNSNPRCTFFPRNTYQVVPLRRCNVSIGNFNINSMCLATDTPKRCDTQFSKRKSTQGVPLHGLQYSTVQFIPLTN